MNQLITRPTNRPPARLWAITDPAIAQPGLYQGKQLIATPEALARAGYNFNLLYLLSQEQLSEAIRKVTQ